ncbi:MAG TPA: TolC family protein [Chitinophagales bacterium]|nr:TolC family protein [Chitinophagales bacterium]HMW13106.1 TolC family protein [Chitinophagales bacterium]HMX59804.1 TolC family protein [Chitinophagales bacterium]HMY24356.1 TolC family protein [Chitinophagales bacterium]HMZ33509.1 TolC family protein [Chitinophagales bacterium]
MKRICIVSIILILAVQIKAQTIKKLNLQEAFELAIQHSKQLQIDSLKIQALDFKKKQAQNAMLPVVAINAGYTRLSDNIPDIIIAGGAFKIEQIVNQFNNRVTLQQPIFQGLRNWNTMKSLDQQKEAASFDKQKNLQDVKLSVVQAYFSLYKLQQAKILLDSNIAQTQTRVNDIIKFKDAGIVLNNDVMRAELQKTNLLVSKADVESAIDVMNYNMCVLLGIENTTKIEVENPDIVNEATASIQSMVCTSFHERAELKAQEFRSKAADYMVKASKSAYMPTINAVGNGMYNNPNQRMFPPEAKFKATWDIGVSLSWNIMQLYTARAIVGDAKNQKAQLEQVTSQIKDGIAMDVNANYEALNVALLKIDLANKAITQARENKRILDNRFDAQVALLSDVLEADQLLLQAQTNLLNAQADVAIANYKLQRSLGAIK